MYDFKTRWLIHGIIVNSEDMEREYWENKSVNVKERNFVYNLEKYTTSTFVRYVFVVWPTGEGNKKSTQKFL